MFAVVGSRWRSEAIRPGVFDQEAKGRLPLELVVAEVEELAGQWQPLIVRVGQIGDAVAIDSWDISSGASASDEGFELGEVRLERQPRRVVVEPVALVAQREVGLDVGHDLEQVGVGAGRRSRRRRSLVAGSLDAPGRLVACQKCHDDDNLGQGDEDGEPERQLATDARGHEPAAPCPRLPPPAWI
jgi:hypothetical protein